MKAYGVVDVYIHVFLTSATVGGEWSASRPGRFTSVEAPGVHWIRGWLGPRTGLDDAEEKEISPIPGLELRPLGRPASRYTACTISAALFIITFLGFSPCCLPHSWFSLTSAHCNQEPIIPVSYLIVNYVSVVPYLYITKVFVITLLF
jgi:hypothetical protein